jgi:hypothetical protein
MLITTYVYIVMLEATQPCPSLLSLTPSNKKKVAIIFALNRYVNIIKAERE